MDRMTTAIMTANNRWVRAADPRAENPRSLDGCGWHDALVEAYRDIRAEWDAFDRRGRRLPRIEQLLDEHQGNEGAWRAGLLVTRGRVVPALADQFAATIAALAQVPGLLSAVWSVLEPGAELPEHHGPNAGVLRYHFCIVSNDQAALRVRASVMPYREREGILFDDTAPHAAWNRGETPRVSILCELLRPLPTPAAWTNAATQRLLAFDRRYRIAPARADEWNRALNPTPSTATAATAAAAPAGGRPPVRR